MRGLDVSGESPVELADNSNFSRQRFQGLSRGTNHLRAWFRGKAVLELRQSR
jgi:hypothetical protein